MCKIKSKSESVPSGCRSDLCGLHITMIATIRWGLRVTPVMGALAVLGIVFLMTDPPRGKADGSHLKPTSPARQETPALLVFNLC
jgi:hypothetical protein